MHCWLRELAHSWLARGLGQFWREHAVNRLRGTKPRPAPSPCRQIESSCCCRRGVLFHCELARWFTQWVILTSWARDSINNDDAPLICRSVDQWAPSPFAATRNPLPCSLGTRVRPTGACHYKCHWDSFFRCPPCTLASDWQFYLRFLQILPLRHFPITQAIGNCTVNQGITFCKSHSFL